MKCSKSFIVTAAVVLVVGGCFWQRLKEMNRIDNPANMTTADGNMLNYIMTWRSSHGKPAMPPTWYTNPPPPYTSNQVLHTVTNSSN